MSNKSTFRRFRALMIALAVVIATNFAISVTQNVSTGKAVEERVNPPKP